MGYLESLVEGQSLEGVKRRQEEAIKELKEINLPIGIDTLVHNDVLDSNRVAMDLYFHPELREPFCWVYPKLSMLIDVAQSYEILNSVEKIKNYILGVLLEGKEERPILDLVTDEPGDSIPNLRRKLIRWTQYSDTTIEEREKLIELLNAWDRAFLDIITNRNLYYKKRIFSEETIGSYLLVYFYYDKSPLNENYVSKVLNIIKYYEIVSGNIDEQHKDYDFQWDMLDLLITLSDDGINPEFWQGILKNDAFIYLSHKAAVKYDFPNKNDLLCKVLRMDEEKNYKALSNPSQIAVFTHFTGRNVRDKFLKERREEIERYFGGESHLNFYVKYPYPRKHIGQTFVVLLDYHQGDGLTLVDYAIVNEDRYEEKRVQYNNQFPDVEFKEQIQELITRHEKFLKQYSETLEKFKKR